MKTEENERLKRVTECFLSFTADPDRNIQLLTNCCGELMGAACALYNRLEDGMLCALAQWNAPPGFNPVDRPDGHICHDVIKLGGRAVFVVQDLDRTGYAKTDPNVSAYCLKTYIGAPVSCNNRCVGSLCVVYQNDYAPDEEERKLMQILAVALGVEEERREELSALRAMKEELEKRVTERTADLAMVNEQLLIDIAERKEAEESLKKSELITRKIFEAIPDLLAVIDRDHRLVQSNWHGGYEYVDELIRNRSPFCYEAFYPGSEGPCDPCHATEVFRTGKPFMTEKINPKIGTVEIRAYPLFDDSGEVSLVVEHIRDITERKRIEEALLENNEKLHAITDTTRDAIVIMDDDGKITFWNPAAETIFGYCAAEAVGNELHMFLAPERYHASYKKGLRQFRETGEGKAVGTTLELDAVRKDGDEFPVELSLSSFRIKGKWHAAGIIRDITGRRMAKLELMRTNEELEKKSGELLTAQEELVRNEKMAAIGRLAGCVGHELRNPLGVMNNAVYFLKTVLADGEETVREYLEIIKQEIDNSQRIISDLLDFSRVKPPRMRMVSVSELINESLFRCAVPDNVELRRELTDTLPALRIDPLQMGQVLQNIITNAVQAMPGGGSLRIAARPVRGTRPMAQGHEDVNVELGTESVEQADDFVEISVADSGEGIKPENMDKIFQPLFTTKARGIGLGLVVCKNLTEANGGRITVESRSGEGTTFTIVLPAG